MLEQKLYEEAKTLLPWLSKVRRDFHQHPELGMAEYRTMDQIAHYLENMGISYEKNVANTGIVAVIEGAKPGKTVALRADMDALPIQEENDVPYRSKVEGKMHACGHDAHMTVQLGAAKLLVDRADEWSGQVKLLFQPAEETVGGAEPMIAAGALKNPDVEAIFGLHTATELPVGSIGVKYGQVNAASDEIKITIRGESAHAAYPANGKDAIMITGQVINAIQTIVSRNVDAREGAVITLGTIEGGTQDNIITDKVKLSGTIRTLDPEVRRDVRARLEETVEYVARGLGGSGTVEINPGYTSLINDDDMVDLVKETGANMLGKDQVLKTAKPSLGVEDFAFFAEAVPGVFYRLGTGNEEKGIVHGGHTPRFDIDEDSLAVGAALQASNAWTYLKKSE